jgi:hypothetical protein
LRVRHIDTGAARQVAGAVARSAVDAVGIGPRAASDGEERHGGTRSL